MTRTAIARTCTFLILAGSWCAPATAQKKAPDGAKVLLLSGGQRQHHGYRDQAFYLSAALEDTGRYEVTQTEEAAVLETPALAKYDLVIGLSDRRDPEFKMTKGQQEALFAYVRGGGGYVSIHGADNAPADWEPEWKPMLGAVFSHFGLPDGKVRKGEYTVRLVDPSSPVAQGLHDFKLNDELYYHLQAEPDLKPLAVVEYEGVDWPVAWTRTYGEGRVFHTVFGHRDFGPDKDDPLRNPDFGKLVLQGIDWVAANKRPAPGE
ncbi:ThuA domain-containing protein [Planctomyces sp. SH-PL62]|uniref:ThuA domain-containing protein n=1 Tax=Planctomyces sp. SH-PL62 TaxID=1636152 RepID=UPI00078BF986|nr:ThuA domain-containing protein [Planctomyces sp. SH-PL62]AMV38566.1 Trehalose utilization [Planctomyces sp. SH-PL62]